MKLISQDEDEVLISATVTNETIYAIQIYDIDGNPVWLPISRIEIVSNKGGVYEILMPIDLAEKKGVI